ncbi:MAG: MFS transporter [Anaerolineales bacterium]|nr:MFS transporter [Chloroflexota bacterium]MBL6982932.1 MFS transporter [Anaerolineales bacterium]
MKQEQKNLIILFFTLVVVMLGFGMIIPIIPFFIESFGASGSSLGMLMASFAVMQFLFAPVWGSLSDRYGRKRFLVIGALGNGIAMLFFGLSSELWMLFASRALSGILSSATLPTAMAYISDSTSDENRGGGMGVVGAAMGMGMVLGPGLGGWLAGSSLSTPFFVAAALSVVAMIFVLVVLPESLPKEKRTSTEGKIQGPQFDEMGKALFSPIGILLVMAFLLSFGLTNFEAVFGLFSLEKHGYGPQRVGTVLTVIGLTSVLMQGVLTGPLTKRWGDVNLLRLSLVGSAIGFVFMLMANSFVTVLITVSVFVISNSLLRPVVSSLTSKRSTSGQGMAMGLNNSFMSLGRIAGPLWAGFIFDVNYNYPYISGSIIMLVGYIVSLIWLSKDIAPQAEISPQPVSD